MSGVARFRILAAAWLLIGATAATAAGQVTTGTITGSVRDPQAAVIPGATVTLISATRGTTLATVTTSTDGDFVFPNVPPDTYVIKVTMDGFKTLERPGIPISPGDRREVPPLVIEVGGLAETVTVSAVASIVQSESGERSFTVATEAVQNLPISNRSFTSLTSLAPGVDVGGNNPGRLGGGGSNNTLMDGVSTVDTGNNQPVLFLNLEAIAEVKVLTSGYQAEYGKASGIQITAVTKSGTNRFRGSIYDVRRDSDWNSNSWQNEKNGNAKNVNKEDDWGYSIGGPIGKPGGRNKLFFFFSQEWKPRTTAGSLQRFRFPTALERQGDFSAVARQQRQPLQPDPRRRRPNLPARPTDQRGCFASAEGAVGRIPANRLYETGLNILKMYPMPTMDTPGLAYNYEVPAPEIKTLNNQPALRFDYQPWTPLRVIFRYAAETQRKETFPGSIPGFNDVQTQNPVIATYAASVNYTINPTTFLEGTYGRIQNELAGCTTLNGVCANAVPMGQPSNKANVGLANLPLIFPDGLGMDSRYYEYETLEAMQPPFWQNGQIMLPPTFAWGNRIGNAPPSINYPAWLNLNRTHDFSLSLTKVWNRHTFKAGFYNHYSLKYQNRGTGGLNNGGPGAMNFGNNTSNPIDSGFGFANAALGIINSYTQMSRFMEGTYVYTNREGYIQDNWKVNNKLTLDYGVRFVHQQPQHDKLLQASNFLPEEWEAAQAPVLYVAGCANGVYPCSGVNRQAMNPRTNQFLGPNTALSIGQLVPGSGNPTNGIFVAGQGIVDTAYKWPAFALAPRFGFAYDVGSNQRVIWRGATGLFYDRPDGNSIYGLVANPPNASTVTINFGQLQNLQGWHLGSAGADGLRVRRAAALIRAVEHRRAAGAAVVVRARHLVRRAVRVQSRSDRRHQPGRHGRGVPSAEPGPDAELDRARRQRHADRPDARLQGLRRDQPVLGPRLERVPLDPDVVQPAVCRRHLVRPELDAGPEQHDQRRRPPRAWRRRHPALPRRPGGSRRAPRPWSAAAAHHQGHVRVGSARHEPRQRRSTGGGGAGQRLAAVGHLHRAVRRSLQRRLRLPGGHRQREPHRLAELWRARPDHR